MQIQAEGSASARILGQVQARTPKGLTNLRVCPTTPRPPPRASLHECRLNGAELKTLSLPLRGLPFRNGFYQVKPRQKGLPWRQTDQCHCRWPAPGLALCWEQVKHRDVDVIVLDPRSSHLFFSFFSGGRGRKKMVALGGERRGRKYFRDQN